MLAHKGLQVSTELHYNLRERQVDLVPYLLFNTAGQPILQQVVFQAVQEQAAVMEPMVLVVNQMPALVSAV